MLNSCRSMSSSPADPVVSSPCFRLNLKQGILRSSISMAARARAGRRLEQNLIETCCSAAGRRCHHGVKRDPGNPCATRNNERDSIAC
jgi:hypothetical protein